MSKIPVFIEEALVINEYINKTGKTQSKVASELGRTQAYVSNKLRLLQLDDELLILITENGLSERHARSLLSISDKESRKLMLEIMIEKRMNVINSEELIYSLQEKCFT